MRIPVLEVLKRQAGRADGIGADAGAGTGLYRRHLHFHIWDDRARAVSRLPIGRDSPFLGFVWVVIAGYLSDHVGRRKMYMIGCVISGLFGFVFFGLLDTKVPSLIFLRVSLGLLPIMNLYGPQAALIAESFSPRLRYSGTSLGYQLASIIAGGPSPFIATALFAAFHSSLPIAFISSPVG